MHMVFGMAADGSAHPTHPGVGPGAIGGAVVGPAGMLDLLAGQLGLSGPPVPPVVRIAAWQAKLETAAAEGPRFYSASLAADALSTARLLLSWRDDLVAAGWTLTEPVAAGPRIADLAAAELAPPPLPRGRSDLLREVIASLASGVRSDVGVVGPGHGLVDVGGFGCFPNCTASAVGLGELGHQRRERVSRTPGRGRDQDGLRAFRGAVDRYC